MKFGPIRLQSRLFFFSFHSWSLQHTYITYFMAHLFYACLAPPIVVGVLLTRQSLDPEYKTTAFFHMYFQEKKTLSYFRVNTVIEKSIFADTQWQMCFMSSSAASHRWCLFLLTAECSGAPAPPLAPSDPPSPAWVLWNAPGASPWPPAEPRAPPPEPRQSLLQTIQQHYSCISYTNGQNFDIFDGFLLCMLKLTNYYHCFGCLIFLWKLWYILQDSLTSVGCN